MHHDQGGLFSQGGKDGSIFQKSINVGHHINKRTGKKNHTIISIDAEKSLDKIQHPFIINSPIKLGIEGTNLNKIKVMTSP